MYEFALVASVTFSFGEEPAVDLDLSRFYGGSVGVGCHLPLFIVLVLGFTGHFVQQLNHFGYVLVRSLDGEGTSVLVVIPCVDHHVVEGLYPPDSFSSLAFDFAAVWREVVITSVITSSSLEWASWSDIVKVIFRFSLEVGPDSSFLTISDIFSARISADSLVMCRPSFFICPLWMLMASVLATAIPCRSRRIALIISVALFLLSALGCGE